MVRIDIAASKHLYEVARSDRLPAFRAFIEAYPALAFLGTILQFHMVLDANAILGDLRWLHLNRRDQTAPTAIQELIVAGVIVPFSPSVLDTELSEYLPQLSLRGAIPASELQAS